MQTFELDFELEEKRLEINKLLLESGRSKFSLSGTAAFNSLPEYQTARVDVEVQQSTLALKDILFFAPHLLDSVPLKIPRDASLVLSTKIRGTVNDLTIERFSVKTLKSTSLAMRGTVKGLPDMDKAQLQISLDRFYTTSRDVHSFLADSLIPTSIQIPDTLELKGSFNGKIKSPVIAAILTTSSGNLETNGKLDFNSTPSYAVTIKTSKLQLGKILKQADTMGMLDMQASASGSGVTMKDINTKVDLLVSRFQYSGYDYKDLKVNGSLNKYLFSGEASMHNENTDFIIKGDLDYTKEVPLYKLNVNLVNADFQKLNLSENPLKARGGLEVNLATADFKVINGDMAIYNVGIYNGKTLYRVDSLLFASIDQEGKSSITIESDILSGKFEGTFNLFSIGTVMKQHINRYFALHDESLKNSQLHRISNLSSH